MALNLTGCELSERTSPYWPPLREDTAIEPLVKALEGPLRFKIFTGEKHINFPTDAEIWAEVYKILPMPEPRRPRGIWSWITGR